jgi:hypothetical protein
MDAESSVNPDWPNGRCLLGEALQDRRLAASRQAADGNNSVLIELHHNVLLKSISLDVEIIHLLGHDI